jgi:hypothetical protein
MAAPKLVSSGCFASNGFVFVIGGSIDQICERYNSEADMWQQIPTFKDNVALGNGLFSYAMCMIK